jgi:hypothetical protein
MALYVAIDDRPRETVGQVAYHYLVTPDDQVHLTLTSTEAFHGLGILELRWTGTEITVVDPRSGTTRAFTLETETPQ